MKMIFFAPLLLLSTIIFSCSKDANSPDDCHRKRRIIKQANGITGVVSRLSNEHPDVWCIVSMQGVIGSLETSYDSRDIVIPCNLPEELKVVGNQVLFSGELKDIGDDFKDSPDKVWLENAYYSELSRIELVNLK